MVLRAVKIDIYLLFIYRDTDAVQTLVTELIIDHYKNTVSKSSAKSQIKGLDFLLHFHPYKPFNMN